MHGFFISRQRHVSYMMSLRRGFPVLLDLALIQVGILLSYLVRFGDELFLYRNAWEPYFNIWAIFNPGPWNKSILVIPWAESSSSCSTSTISTPD